MGHSAVRSALLVSVTGDATPDLVVMRVHLAEAQAGDQVVVTCRLYQPPVDRGAQRLTFFGSGSVAHSVLGAGSVVEVPVALAPFVGHPVSPALEVLVLTDIVYCTAGSVPVEEVFPDGGAASLVPVDVPLDRVDESDQAVARLAVYQRSVAEDGTRVLLAGGLVGGRVSDLDTARRSGTQVGVTLDLAYTAPNPTGAPSLQQVLETTTACTTLLEPGSLDPYSTQDAPVPATWVNLAWTS